MVALRESERQKTSIKGRERERERERDVIKKPGMRSGGKNGREILGWYFSSAIYRSG